MAHFEAKEVRAVRGQWYGTANYRRVKCIAGCELTVSLPALDTLGIRERRSTSLPERKRLRDDGIGWNFAGLGSYSVPPGIFVS